jgi:alkanesulfonate monooxygenase SsuD/methylene tetrahydromethanopterin reductase-like flavin-dependent oxidoreductase (luciferase family)
MLQTAGAWADGVIVELATMNFVRWAWEQIRAGAAAVGRDLTGFEFIYQSQMALVSDDPLDRERTFRRVDFLVNHMLQPEFDHMWKGGGLWDQALRVRQLVAAGDRPAAEQLVEREALPLMSIIGERRQIPGRLMDWLDEIAAAGVTQVTLPLDMESSLGVGLAEARAHLGA